ncbi:MAG: hypothetical protein R3F60_08735 [bacterium]
MLPVEFSPIAPYLCLTLALLAVPLAAGLRRLAPRARRWWLPNGLSLADAALTGLVCAGGLVAILLAGPVLEWASARLLLGAGAGRTLADPATWAAAGAALLVSLSLQAWRLLLLAWPIFFALGRITEARWPLPATVGLGLAASGPLLGAVVVVACPLEGTARTLAVAALLWALPALAWPATRVAAAGWRRYRRWRADGAPEQTRVSTIPAAMAASLQVGEGRTTGFVRVGRAISGGRR